MILENLKYFVNLKLLMLVVGDRLAQIAQVFAHTGREDVAVALLQKISYSALAALRVHSDDVCIVGAADIVRVDGDIGDVPLTKSLFLAVLHALCDSVLMAAGECREHQSSGIGGALINVHSGAFLIHADKVWHIGKVELGVNTVAIHIHCKGDNIHVAGSFAVAEESALYPVRARQDCKLGIRNAGSPVVVRVK